MCFDHTVPGLVNKCLPRSEQCPSDCEISREYVGAALVVWFKHEPKPWF